MTLFYDPIKRQPKPWIFVFFIILTVIFLISTYIAGRGYVQTHPAAQEEQKAPKDIFAE